MSVKHLKKCDVSVCHAECCGIVPIPNETISAFGHLLRSGVSFVPFDKKTTICADENGVCGFLTADYRCAIYDNRPEICRIFGGKGQKHTCLKCSYLRKKGETQDVFTASEIYALAEKLGIE